MKIIALLAMKNEAGVLPTYLSSVARIADKIIAVDDGSTDASRALVEQAGGLVAENNERIEAGWPEFSIRQQLLALGRQHGGTHFICLDADEALSAPFLEKGRNLMESMRHGEKLWMRWITLWHSSSKYRTDGIYASLSKDFVFCDDGVSAHEYAFLGVSRTPGRNATDCRIDVPQEDGVTLHYQYALWHRTQAKQAWYRCSEYLDWKRSARRINHAYSGSIDTPEIRTTTVSADWTRGIIQPSAESDKADWHLAQVLRWLDERGPSFFEPLQIWHVPELRKAFVDREKREPNPKTFPAWIIALNNLKHAAISALPWKRT